MIIVKIYLKNLLFVTGIVFFLISCRNNDYQRKQISLNGEWSVTETNDTIPPSEFSRKIQVPSLIDLAVPKFDNPGFTYIDLGPIKTADPNHKRKYFWYKRRVKLDTESPEFAILKVHKAKFGHTVYVNGNYVGHENYCFTPSFFEISKYLNFDSENEILIRVGASPVQLPDSIPFGFDYEKSLYFSGIYDNVELLMGGYPYIENVQIVPDIKNKLAKAIVYVENGNKESKSSFVYKVWEKNSTQPIATGQTQTHTYKEGEIDTIHLTIEIPDCKLWSPENPFLYELEIKSGGDSKKVTFGMREFRFDTTSHLALLNDKPYYLRGTNIAMHRFFEDTVRNNLPWRKDWVEKMHDEFKDMYWNSYRFHVGFAPEAWYEVADEKGFLIQDEYPIWGLWPDGAKERHKVSVLVEEYKRWIKERWNHPSVVIWDAQNETQTDLTGQVIQKVRGLDFSGRPWDNGYSPPQSINDVIESHPYLFVFDHNNTFSIIPPWLKKPENKWEPVLPEGGLLKDELSISPEPFNDVNEYNPPAKGEKYPNSVIVNEYGWIWLYRDGSPAWVAEDVWKCYPEYDTPEMRWDWRGRVIAAKTEYWRSRRDLAGVQHFCVLTCDRPWGEKRSQVSDEWQDVPGLIMQPLFKKYVKSAFSPVGLFIDQFDREYHSSKEINVPVAIYNDLEDNWKGDMIFKIVSGDSIVDQKHVENVTINPYQKEIYEFNVTLPAIAGEYEMIAEIKYNEDIVFSSRLFRIE